MNKKINIDRPFWATRLVRISGNWFFVGKNNIQAKAQLMVATIEAIKGHEEVELE